MEKPKVLSGFRDSLPVDMIERQRLIEKIREVFELYGYDPVETPSLEYYETLTGKEGGDCEKLMYDFHDHGDRHIGLIYDLTVPISRLIANNNEIPQPFKRYQIQRVYRAERPQKGRYREFYQCDVDIFGTDSPEADAEIVTILSDSLSRLGFEKYRVHVNARDVLIGLLDTYNVPKQMHKNAIISIDKLDKIGKEGVEKELMPICGDTAKEVVEAIGAEGTDEEKFKRLETTIKTESGLKAIELVKTIISISGSYGAKVIFDPSLARGQSYYTGPVFEAKLDEPKIGSVAGGGRYDNLVGIFSGKQIPAVGASLGFDRILAAMDEIGLTKRPRTVTDVFIAHFGGDSAEYARELACMLRENNINTQTAFEATKIIKQFKYADKKGIPIILTVGDDERAKQTVQLKDMRDREQEEVGRDRLIDKIKEILK
ncbi:MAG TPA: histidine--tRNA ligase [Caldisericia bacterium]|nr:histidine--tRNA ligase [Caldisericia bacterium]HPF48814.1 histidine--tRNA ligase [Caldisericia bacterium]HPI84262.1 histidine--tRNA ligase [Caldisericia bacterium]HPQ93440.1 histidine--tRNA ligase [Caldisericia bacterium]HRV74898.1 histidine--tRNA ligase [Caldisericia bacterium]